MIMIEEEKAFICLCCVIFRIFFFIDRETILSKEIYIKLTNSHKLIN